VVGRTLAMLGGDAAPAVPTFTVAQSVPNAGVLVAIPALIANGLYHELGEHLQSPRGFYGLPQLVLLLALLTVARVLSLERLRDEPCGEWGRLLGLDRIPEVRTLRAKIGAMVTPAGVAAWAESLGKRWMEDDPQLAGVLYVDGHVRAYHGDQTRLPERFSSRDRLCVRSLMDYYVCDRDGKPFFVVTAVGTEGMLYHLRTNIIPRLLAEVPNQPTTAELAADPERHRFLIVFDREGYSPAFFAELWNTHRIAAVTYRKGDYEPWDHARFTESTVVLPYGNETVMRLAESCDTMIARVKLREIRRLCQDGKHQAAMITTCRSVPTAPMAGHLFSRWSQENFLNFVTRSFAIDRLAGYLPEAAPDDAEVRNPVWRTLDQQARRLRTERTAITTKHGRDLMVGDDPAETAAYLVRAADYQQRFDAIEAQIVSLNAQLRATAKRVRLCSLSEADRPRVISPHRQRFITTIKLIAYRAESAICSILRPLLSHAEESRSLAQTIWKQPGDLVPDHQNKTLTVRLHHFPSPQTSRNVEQLFNHLNQTDVEYPGTGLRLRYALVSPTIPGDPGP
jgi:hypothetical protein